MQTGKIVRRDKTFCVSNMLIELSDANRKKKFVNFYLEVWKEFMLLRIKWHFKVFQSVS